MDNLAASASSKDTEEQSEDRPHERFTYDKRAYYIMVLLGVGVLLPWNVILNTLDFLKSQFPSADIDYKVTPAYVWPQLPLLALMVKVSSQRVLCKCATAATRSAVSRLWHNSCIEIYSCD